MRILYYALTTIGFLVILMFNVDAIKHRNEQRFAQYKILKILMSNKSLKWYLMLSCIT